MFDPAATRRIGRRDLHVSQLGVGTAPFGSASDSDSGVKDAFDALYGAGLRYFDTAPFYGTGLAERRLGACIRSAERSSLVLSSKAGRLLSPTQATTSGPDAFEVRYDYMEGVRFRHTAQFERWRPDREPRSCTYQQLERPVRFQLADVLTSR